MTLKDILKSILKSAPAKSIPKKEPIKGSEFLVKLEDRVKSTERTTCIFISAEHTDSVYIHLQEYLHSNNGRYPQDMISKVGGRRIGLALSIEYNSAKELINKFIEEYKLNCPNINYTLAEYQQSKNFKEFLIKAQTEKAKSD